MPFRLIFTIILVVFVVVITGFNLDNKCNIWLFHTFEDIPVIATILTSFVAGVIVTLPSVFIHKGKKSSNTENTKEKTPKVKKQKPFIKNNTAAVQSQQKSQPVATEDNQNN